ncbi:MAG: CmpA/NrtA family ABC transporter substrate-binding protein [Rhodospirillaceae bacterium]
MSAVSKSAPRGAAAKLRIGFLRLTDAAPVILAHEFGFFADEGVDAELSVEPSWANIGDKLAFGFLDAAVIVPPLAFAVELGLRGAAQPLIIPYTVSLGGNAVTLNRALADEVKARASGEGLSTAAALAVSLRRQHATLGVVHAYSTHNLMLRYWLATAGLEAGRDFTLAVVPPARAVEALTTGQIAGFCAGAPWGKVAARTGAGTTVATSDDIWTNAPEKGLAVRSQFGDAHPGVLQGALRALLRAARFCDAPENASYTAALLSRRQYLDVDGHAILASLPGGASPPEPVATFFRGAANFPWRSQGLWFLTQMARWGLLDPATDMRALAQRVYRPDLYRPAAARQGVAAPLADWKDEGAHSGAWLLDAAPQSIAMGPDRFCDGAVFAAGGAGT